jgi:hypothetical protein
MSVNNFFNNLYKDNFSLNSLYEIVRNIFTVIVIGIALYIFIEIYSITSDYLLLFLLALVGVLFYFCFPIVSKIPKLLTKVIARFILIPWYPTRVRHLRYSYHCWGSERLIVLIIASVVAILLVWSGTSWYYLGLLIIAVILYLFNLFKR